MRVTVIKRTFSRERTAMKKVAVALVLVLASLALVACGGGSSDSSESTGSETTSESGGAAGGGEAEGGAGGGASTLAIEAASSGLAYASNSASASAGEVTLEFNNPQPITHDVAIEDSSGETIGQTELVAEGESSTVVELEPGTYTFFCTVPGHRDAGMEGTLTVK
jgi:plastocyanin